MRMRATSTPGGREGSLARVTVIVVSRVSMFNRDSARLRLISPLPLTVTKAFVGRSASPPRR